MAAKDYEGCMPVKSSARKKLSRAGQRDLDTKIEFLEGLVRRDSNYADALQLLGDHYTQRGRYLEGLKVDESLARLEPRNPLVFYNLACSYALTDHFDRAVLALEKAINLGYRDFNWLAKDPDLRKLRQQPVYRNIRDKIRRIKVEVR
jgi:tetratricopeptide (TPR) repeat protein